MDASLIGGVLESAAVHKSYQQLVADVDRMTAELTSRYASHLQCRAGCSGCCHHHLSVSRIEAQSIAEVVHTLRPEIRTIVADQSREVMGRETRGEDVTCPLLVDDKCSIYENRPIICRTQGLPLLIKSDDGSDEVDWCPLNFTTSDAVQDLDEQHLVPLDDLNLQLALVNLAHARELGLADDESGQRFSIAEIILDSATPDKK